MRRRGGAQAGCEMAVAYALDAVNFLSADVRNLFGPVINVYLVTVHHWSQTDVGLIVTASGLLGLAVQTPVGAWMDLTTRKREAIVGVMAALAVAALILFRFPQFWPIAAATVIIAVAGDFFVPAVSALTLGLTPKAALARRLGRNSAWNHAGNIAIAIIAAGVGYLFTQRAVFLLAPLFAILTSVAVLSIPPGKIDHDRARDLGREGEGDGAPADYGVLLRTKPLVIFAVCALLFHFANAPLLPLVGQKLAFQYPGEATAMLSACMVAAQGVMLPIAIFVGRNADRIGRRPIFLVAFAVLPIRAALYTFSNNAFWLLGVQLLDGVAAGVYEALTPLLIADIMRGTGRYNLAQGAVATTQGVGAAISALAAGAVTDRFGYSAAFLFLGAAAAVAWGVFLLFMPETRDEASSARAGGKAAAVEPA